MKIFITGGTGNIGQYVTRALLARGHELVLYTRTAGRIPALGLLDSVTLAEGDLLDREKMAAALVGCQAVVHIALGWGNTPLEMLDHDTKSTVYLAEAAEQTGVENFVYTSSTAAMGVFFDGIGEEAPCRPGDLYGATKAASEAYLLGFRQYYTGQGVYGRKVKMRRNIIRPGYTFSNPGFEGGASQSDTRFRDIARAVLENENLVIDPCEGTQFLSSRQLAELYVKLVEGDWNEQVVLGLGATFTTWADIARMALACVPESTSKILAPEGAKPRSPELVSVAKMERDLGLRFDATEDLQAHVRWNVERERRVLLGETVHDVYHVW